MNGLTKPNKFAVNLSKTRKVHTIDVISPKLNSFLWSTCSGGMKKIANEAVII